MGLRLDLPTEIGATDPDQNPESSGTGTPRDRRSGLDRLCQSEAVDRFVRWVDTWAP